ncbi:MAG TPA: hypothetical protein VKU41_13800 [Polyangiaceae bacterium]|nr:hypothetical protein [Polyangiaceae bacterium]
MSSSRPPDAPSRLTDILRAVPQRELDGLIERLGIRIDPAKRIDVPSQVARALVSLPELRDPSRLNPACVELVHRVAEARGTLLVPSVPPALEPLLARGLLFARSAGAGVELILPSAYLVQLKAWEGEDPRGMRALISQASFETMSAVASHYLGRPATPPIALSLESAWDIVGDPQRLADEIAKLSPTERRVLEGVEAEGGEVDTEELLELEREPLRLRTATGATPSRRGVGFSLERRALLIPVHPNRHVVPTEVSAIIGAAHHSERAARREEVKVFVASGDHAPRRARFSLDPAPLAMGLAVVARESSSRGMEAGRTGSGQFADVRAGVGTPKSLVQKLAARFGRDPAHVALVVALSRAIGLWDASAINTASPPGTFTLQDLARYLFIAWRRGGAWDEARSEPEMLRIAPESRDTSPAGVVREMMLDALRELGEGRWVPWSSLAGWLKSDHRVPGLARLLRRWAERVAADPVEPIEVARRIIHESLPALGIVDLGEDEDLPRDPEVDGDAAPIALRLTARGRAMLADKTPVADADPSKFLDTHVLRLGGPARVGAILGIAPFVEVGRAAETLDLIVAPQTLARALSAGLEADVLRARIEALAPLPDTLSRTLAQASVVVGRASWNAAAGFLWIEDGNVREMLRTRRPTQDLFVDPSPPGGLLVAAGVDLDRLARRCRTIGVEILSDGQVVRARTIPPPGPSKSVPPPRATPGRGTAKADK